MAVPRAGSLRGGVDAAPRHSEPHWAIHLPLDSGQDSGRFSALLGLEMFPCDDWKVRAKVLGPWHMVVVVWAETQVWYASMLVLAPQQYSPTSWVFLKVTWNPKKWVLQDDFSNLEMSIFMFHHVSILGPIGLRPAKRKQVIAYLIVFIDFPNKTILFLSAGFPIQIYDWLHPLFFFRTFIGPIFTLGNNL